MLMIQMKMGVCSICHRFGGDLVYRTLLNLAHASVVRILSCHRVIDGAGALTEADRADLADLLRVARGAVQVQMRELEEERLKLKSWQFGQLFESTASTSGDGESEKARVQDGEANTVDHD